MCEEEGKICEEEREREVSYSSIFVCRVKNVSSCDVFEDGCSTALFALLLFSVVLADMRSATLLNFYIWACAFYTRMDAPPHSLHDDLYLSSMRV